MRAIEMVSRNERVLGGAPVFANTRVLVRTLFDYLEAGDSLDRFLEHFPNVSREQAIAVMARASRGQAIAIIQISGARSNRLEDVLPYVPGVLDVLPRARPGAVARVKVSEDRH